MTNPQTRSADFGLIGYPLGHSFSKMFFTRLFTEDGSGRVYENFELPELTSESLYNIILMNPDLIGFNVTAPYKQAIIPFLDSVDELASEVGAVNTVKIIRADGGRLKALEGYNTDVRGFGESVASFLGEARPAALILGTGGASHAVEVALHRMGICTTLVSRSKKGQGIITYDDIDAATLRDNQLIVNATPLGTFPDTDSMPPLPYDLLTPANYCFDLVYNPGTTMFMSRARQQGAKVCNGLDMLFIQAMASFEIWTKPLIQ